MENTFKLKDGAQIVIRDLKIEDAELSNQFFLSIPEERRRYFRSDVTNREHISDRIRQTESGTIIRRIALLDGNIVGDASLEIETSSWKSGEAQLRLVVTGEFQGRGIQFFLAKDLYELALKQHLNKIIVKFMRPQTDLMVIYDQLGFKRQGVLTNYVVDQAGEEQDMVIMVATLADIRRAYQFIGDWLDDGHSTIGAGEM